MPYKHLQCLMLHIKTIITYIINAKMFKISSNFSQRALDIAYVAQKLTSFRKSFVHILVLTSNSPAADM
jgi:hypothetical protein